MLAKQLKERRDRIARAAVVQIDKPKMVDWPRAASAPAPAEILVFPCFVFFSDIDRQIASVPKTRLREIQNMVCSRLRVPRADLLSTRRDRAGVEARQIAMYLCKTSTSLSFPEIARRFGGVDHTTVLAAVRKIAIMMKAPRGTSTMPSYKPEAMDVLRRHVEVLEAEIATWNEEPNARCKNPGFKATIG